jgi:hypothetical protein
MSEEEKNKRYENLLRATGVLADPPTRRVVKEEPKYSIMAGYVGKLVGQPYAATLIETGGQCPCGRPGCGGGAMFALWQGLN